MEEIKGVTIDECVIGREYWLDDWMDECGIYAGKGRWVPVIIHGYLVSDNGLVYCNGGYFYPKNKNIIQIPAGHTAKIENGTVIFEPEPEKVKFKKGDFVKTDNSYAIIKNSATFEVYVEFFLHSKNLYELGYTESKLLRLMADYEKQILLDKLHEAGKDWDAEKFEIVDWVWKPKAGDSIWSINGRGGIFEWTFSGKEEYLPQTVDFRTKELAEAALELLKQAKHF